MRLDKSLPGVMTSGCGMDTPSPDFLPQKVVTVSKEVLRAFAHTKRVGNYLLGKTLGEGSFAKVKEAMHTLTGEKVWYIVYCCCDHSNTCSNLYTHVRYGVFTTKQIIPKTNKYDQD